MVQGGSRPRISRRETIGPCPLSFGQQRLWFLDQIEHGPDLYNVARALRISGPLDRNALRAALDGIVARHEVLRTTFTAADGAPAQIIGEARSVDLRVIDLTSLRSEEKETLLRQRLTAEAHHPFDLASDLLLRAVLVQLDRHDHALLLVTHHIVSDAWSMEILLRELAALYISYSCGTPSHLPDLPIRYADYALWQRQWLQGDVLEDQLSYWVQRLGNGIPLLELPIARSRPKSQSCRGGRKSLLLPSDLLDGLKELSRREGVTLFMTLLAAFQTLLYRYTGQEAIALGTPIAGRRLLETENLIGFFVNTLVLRANLADNLTFRELLSQVKETALGAYTHQDLPFEKLVEQLHPNRDVGRNPLVRAAFQLKNVRRQPAEIPGLEISEIELDVALSKFDLHLETVERTDGLLCNAEYDTDIFDGSNIARMLGHYRVLLEGVVADPGQRLSELPLLTGEERHRLVVEWNGTEREYPRDRCIHELFEEQVERTPEAVAVVYGDDRLTFRELNARANQLAHYLRGIGVGAQTLVGICVDRSLEMVVGLLGILKAGGAYVPLDPADPNDRMDLVVTDAQLEVFLTQGQLQTILPRRGARIVCMDSDWEMVSEQSTENQGCSVDAASAGYVMYTSGSTGMPKGVVVPHRAVVRLVVNTDYVQLGPTDVVAQLSNFSFDALTFEVWGALLNGSRLAIIKKETALVPSELASQLNHYGVTTMFLTTAWFNLVASEAPGVFRQLRHVLFGGEVADPRSIREVLASGPPVHLLHMYGPTEATTFTTWHEVGSVAEGVATVPIGRPIANARVYLLDPHQQPVPVGVAGELYVGGDGLATSYLSRPELTETRFVADPFRQGDRLYRTGDLARYLPDGNIEFVGRTDQQVKIRGYRVELGEVEAALNGYPGVKEAVVVAGQEGVTTKSLMAYVVPERGGQVNPSELRQHVRRKLPEYMVPSAFAVLGELPLMPNGKVDRRALQAMEVQTMEASEPEGHYVAPGDELELRMVELWEKVLGIHPIGVESNFFELGGYSLLAVQLFAEIEKAFGTRLPLATLFEGATIRQLANCLRGEGKNVDWISLVPIQPTGSMPPLFCVHGVGGEVLNYRDLARHLGDDQPVYGLQARGLDGRHAPHYSIREAAVGYVNEMLDLQPEGPYYLAGFSSGGVWAFEVAQQLLARGKRVAMLALFDSGCPRYGRLIPVLQRTRKHWAVLSKLPREERLPYVLARVDEIKSRLRRRFRVLGLGKGFQRGKGLPSVTEAVENATWVAFDSYTPQRYAGRITLFWAMEHGLFQHFDPDPRLGWSRLAEDGVDVQEIAGVHVSMIREPVVQQLAEKLRVCLRKAREGAEQEGYIVSKFDSKV